MLIRRAFEVLMSGGTARADFGADHAVYHQGMAVTPGRKHLINVNE